MYADEDTSGSDRETTPTQSQLPVSRSSHQLHSPLHDRQATPTAYFGVDIDDADLNRIGDHHKTNLRVKTTINCDRQAGASKQVFKVNLAGEDGVSDLDDVSLFSEVSEGALAGETGVHSEDADIDDGADVDGDESDVDSLYCTMKRRAEHGQYVAGQSAAKIQATR